MIRPTDAQLALWSKDPYAHDFPHYYDADHEVHIRAMAEELLLSRLREGPKWTPISPASHPGCGRCVCGYEVRRENRPGDGEFAGWFRTLKEAQETAVPGHPDEWVWSDAEGGWFHGSGSNPGEWFLVRATFPAECGVYQVKLDGNPATSMHGQAPSEELAAELAEQEFLLKDQLIAVRRAAGLEQADVARVLKVDEGVIAELERLDSDPTLSMLRHYAHAVGAVVSYQVEPNSGSDPQ